MGIYDREYYREEDERRFRKSTAPMSMVTKIVLVTSAIYLVSMFTKYPPDALPAGSTGYKLTDFMTLDADAFQHPWKLYQLVAAGFMHAPPNSPSGLFHILFNMFTLYMLGQAVERKYGRGEFLAFYLVAIVIGNLAWLLFENITYAGAPPAGVGAYGASGGVMAVVILFCVNWPKQTLLLFGVIPMPAWSLAALIVGLDVMRAFNPAQHQIAWQAHLAGAAFGATYFFLNMRLTRFLPGKFSRSMLKPKPKLRVHDPDKRYHDLVEQGDRILDKIHREGEESLTPKERRILEEYSRHMRQRHR